MGSLQLLPRAFAQCWKAVVPGDPAVGKAA